ncbi:MAG TPA: CcoQ/FixQ family Cbb3-type cytochrome c oxidase assembly chaperone [Woeseiaceae bacterium]|nr:CcoQ/FixQ family Cbb3-type cytochrome c oxidase assembly chaperone [Woeseiaceae bacterium]
MDMGIVRGLVTAVLLVLFTAIWIASWSRKRKTDFDEAARLPLVDDEAPARPEERR